MTLALVALAGAGADLAHKSAAMGDGPIAVHERPAVWVVVFAALALLEAAAISLTGSRALAWAGGLLVGGSAGNLVSAAIWGGVPDPIAASGVYFSAGDVLIGAGVALLLPATAHFARRNRARLSESVLP
jgi:lipoprotein signal peptidase